MVTGYWFRPIILAGDVLLYFGTYEAAFYLRFLGHPPKANHEAFLRVLPWLLLSLIVLHLFYRLYDLRTPWDEVAAGVVSAAFLNTVVAFAVSFLVRGFAFPRTVFALALLMATPVLLVWRRAIHVYSAKMYTQKVIVVGPLEEAVACARRIDESPSAHIEVSAVIPIHDQMAPETMKQTAAETGAGTILLCGGIEPGRKMQLIEGAYRVGLEVLVIPDLPEILMASARRERVDDYLVFRVGGTGVPWDPVKRLFDITVAALGLFISLPIMALLALAIRLDSSGPVLYRQTRVTAGGNRFTLYKFRTMYDGAEASTGPILSRKGDPRVTRVGRFLRASRLDELPQLWNVLRGDMSLVGPRPERPHFVEKFAEELPHYTLRHQVRPGLTGLAQVNGYYSSHPADKLRFDLLYILARSFYMDLAILLETLRAVLTRGRSA